MTEDEILGALLSNLANLHCYNCGKSAADSGKGDGSLLGCLRINEGDESVGEPASVYWVCPECELTSKDTVSLSDEAILENGFWISSKNSKKGIGVRAIPFYDDSIVEIESIALQGINRNRNEKIVDEIVIYKNEFERLIQLAGLLRKEEKHGK